MDSIPVTQTLSLDHTFKVSSNIGYCRPDNKWVTLYSSVFMCMNGVGQVVGWQFTSTTSIDEVHALLTRIKNRAQDQNIQIFVGNCCTVRNKLQDIFSTNADIKLDVFHAIQRITRKLPKRHPFFQACKDDLKLLVRDRSDSGQQRKQDTTSPKHMMENLEHFEEKWTLCNKDGWNIISDGAKIELTSLKSHIQKGCLSDIRPGSGTNRNEALHRRINPSFSNRSRIGLPLALALLTLLLYVHNTRIEEKITGNPSYPIQCLSKSQSEAYIYGVDRKCDDPNISWVSSDIVQKKGATHLNFEGTLTYANLHDDSLISHSIIKNAVHLTEVAKL